MSNSPAELGNAVCSARRGSGEKDDKSSRYNGESEDIEMSMVRSRRIDEKWIKEVPEWYPRKCEKVKERPQGKRVEEIRKMLEVK